MRTAVAITLAAGALYFAGAPSSAKAEAVVRNGVCFSGVSDDVDLAEQACKATPPGFTCTAPKTMVCEKDSQRQTVICRCKKAAAYFRDSDRRQSKPAPEGEYQLEGRPQREQETPTESEPN